ncbi:MAG: glycosyltransferase family 2 protein [Gordonia sp. (in: high G+C Gram-positive bacteria)]|uniref:glycosyltransferase n=1 Tax=Gordonia sp. (in: high G+C Gram-positive bacteria) TaxID=84139 RepID=UPI003C739D47
MQTLSVLVPAFNEEASIAACLDNLLNQTHPIDEIVVIDNGSTDSTASVVKTYVDHYGGACTASGFARVRLVSEPAKGVVEAVATGFSTASGEIIGRTDADSLVTANWAEAMMDFFSDPENTDYGAITGLVMLSDGPARERLLAMQTKAAAKFAEGRDIESLAGANLAMRRECWELVSDKLTRRPDIWDDLDLSLALAEQGVRSRLHPGMVVDTSGRQLRFSPVRNWHYLSGGVRTAKARGNDVALRRMRLDLPFRLIMAFFLWIVLRPWDNDSKTWRPHRLFVPLERERALITTGRDLGGSDSAAPPPTG